MTTTLLRQHLTEDLTARYRSPRTRRLEYPCSSQMSLLETTFGARTTRGLTVSVHTTLTFRFLQRSESARILVQSMVTPDAMTNVTHVRRT